MPSDDRLREQSYSSTFVTFIRLQLEKLVKHVVVTSGVRSESPKRWRSLFISNWETNGLLINYYSIRSNRQSMYRSGNGFKIWDLTLQWEDFTSDIINRRGSFASMCLSIRILLWRKHWAIRLNVMFVSLLAEYLTSESLILCICVYI